MEELVFSLSAVFWLWEELIFVQVVGKASLYLAAPLSQGTE